MGAVVFRQDISKKKESDGSPFSIFLDPTQSWFSCNPIFSGELNPLRSRKNVGRYPECQQPFKPLADIPQYLDIPECPHSSWSLGPAH